MHIWDSAIFNRFSITCSIHALSTLHHYVRLLAWGLLSLATQSTFRKPFSVREWHFSPGYVRDNGRIIAWQIRHTWPDYEKELELDRKPKGHRCEPMSMKQTNYRSWRKKINEARKRKQIHIELETMGSHCTFNYTGRQRQLKTHCSWERRVVSKLPCMKMAWISPPRIFHPMHTPLPSEILQRPTLIARPVLQ